MAYRVAIVAALIGGAGWIAKMFIMWSAGGPNLDSIPESIAFFLGFLGIPIAAAAAGWALTAGAVRWKRIAAAAAGLITPLAIVGLVQGGLAAVLPDAGWFRDEAILGVLGVTAVVLAVGALVAGRSVAAPPSVTTGGSAGA